VSPIATASESIEDEAPMSAKTQYAAEDLAFMRTLVEGNDTRATAAFGEVYFAGGLIYGLQIVLQSLPGFGLWTPPPAVQLALGIGPTLIFVIFLLWSILRNKAGPVGGVAQRAVGTVFAVVGCANLALVVIIGSVALRHKSLEIWLIYPCVVFVLQGAAWVVTGLVRRQLGPALLGAAWMVAAIAMGVSIPSIPLYSLIAGAALIGFMAVPGWAMMRLDRKAA
jgi:hypothetical protein